MPRDRESSLSKSERDLRDLPVFTIPVAGKRRSYRLHQIVSVRGREKILDTHVDRVLFWQTQRAEFAKRVRVLEDKIDAREKVAYWSHRQRSDENKQTEGKRQRGLTDAQIRVLVRMDPETDKLRQKLERAQYRVDMCQAICKALDHRQTVLMFLLKSTPKG